MARVGHAFGLGSSGGFTFFFDISMFEKIDSCISSSSSSDMMIGGGVRLRAPDGLKRCLRLTYLFSIQN